MIIFTCCLHGTLVPARGGNLEKNLSAARQLIGADRQPANLKEVSSQQGSLLQAMPGHAQNPLVGLRYADRLALLGNQLADGLGHLLEVGILIVGILHVSIREVASQK